MESDSYIEFGDTMYAYGHHELRNDCSGLECRNQGEYKIGDEHFCQECLIKVCEKNPQVTVNTLLIIMRALKRRDLL